MKSVFDEKKEKISMTTIRERSIVVINMTSLSFSKIYQQFEVKSAKRILVFLHSGTNNCPKSVMKMSENTWS